MKDIRQIALDADIGDLDARAITLEKITRCNPDHGPLRGMSGEGLGVKLRANDQIYGDIFLANDNAEANAFLSAYSKHANDTDTVSYNNPSNGAMQAATVVFTTLTIPQVFQTTPLTQVTESFQQGSFGTTDIFIAETQGSGASKLYGDFSPAGPSDFNVNWLQRQVVNLERTITYGDLEIAQMAMAKIDSIATRRSYLATLINLDINNIGYSGYEGMRIFGLLNDPGLNATIQAPDGVSGSPLWATKDYLEITADIRNLIGSTIAEAGGNAGIIANAAITDGVYLQLPPCVIEFLAKQPALPTMTCLQYLAQAFPNVEIIQVQNLQGTRSAPDQPIGSGIPNKAQVIWKKFAGMPVALNAFVTPYNSHGVVRMQSSYSEKVSYSLAGSIAAQPIGIGIMEGI